MFVWCSISHFLRILKWFCCNFSWWDPELCASFVIIVLEVHCNCDCLPWFSWLIKILVFFACYVSLSYWAVDLFNSTYACDVFGWLFWLGGSLFCCKFSGLISFREIRVWFWIECCLLPTYGGHYRIHMKFVCIKQRTTGNITIFSVISIMHQKSSCHNHLWWNQNVYIFATNKTMSSFRKS